MQATVFEITTIAVTGGMSAAILLRAVSDQLKGTRRRYLRFDMLRFQRGV